MIIILLLSILGISTLTYVDYNLISEIINQAISLSVYGSITYLWVKYNLSEPSIVLFQERPSTLSEAQSKFNLPMPNAIIPTLAIALNKKHTS